jgi:hypothetical protein
MAVRCSSRRNKLFVAQTNDLGHLRLFLMTELVPTVFAGDP